MIPLALFNRIIEFLEKWNLPEYHYIYDDYIDILWDLRVKMHKLDLRQAYLMIAQASDEDARQLARLEYLRQKEQMRFFDQDVGDLPF